MIIVDAYYKVPLCYFYGENNECHHPAAWWITCKAKRQSTGQYVCQAGSTGESQGKNCSLAIISSRKVRIPIQ